MIHEAIVRSSPVPMLLVRDGELVFANPAGARLLGTDFADEVIGRRLAEWLPQIEAGEITAWLANVQSTSHGEPLRRVVLRSPTGSTQVVEVTATRMIGADHLGVLLTLRRATVQSPVG